VPKSISNDKLSIVCDSVTLENVKRLSDDGLLAGTKQQYGVAKQSYLRSRADIGNLLVFCQEIIDRFKDQNTAEDKRGGKPTVREAFSSIGMSYDAVRQWFHRYKQDVLPSQASPPKPLLTDGDEVKDKATGDIGEVTAVRGGTTVDVVFKGDAKPTTVPVTDLIKLRSQVRSVQVGDLFLLTDKGAEYEYRGDGKFARTETPTLAQQKQSKEVAKEQAAKVRKAAAAAEKKAAKERREEERKAKAARRDLDRLAAKQAKAAEKATRNAEPATRGSIIGVKSEATPNGYYWEGRKHATHPYVVTNVNHLHIPIIKECKTRTEAEQYVNDREKEAAAAGQRRVTV
jgi:hypothetical protein